MPGYRVEGQIVIPCRDFATVSKAGLSFRLFQRMEVRESIRLTSQVVLR
jgi:hypothetical protein